MKGLLLKDFYQLKAYTKSIILILIMYSFLIFSQEKEDMLQVGITIFMLVLSMMAISTFNYDEKNNTNRYLVTLSISKKEMVLEKYILTILGILVGTILGIIISILVALLKVGAIPNIGNSIPPILGFIFGISIYNSIQIPLIYKYGAEKGRIQVYVIGLTVVIIGIIIHTLIPNITIDLSIIKKLEKFIPYILIILTVIMYTISYKISCKIYEKKEL